VADAVDDKSRLPDVWSAAEVSAIPPWSIATSTIDPRSAHLVKEGAVDQFRGRRTRMRNRSYDKVGICRVRRQGLPVGHDNRRLAREIGLSFRGCGGIGARESSPSAPIPAATRAAWVPLPHTITRTARPAGRLEPRRSVCRCRQWCLQEVAPACVVETGLRSHSSVPSRAASLIVLDGLIRDPCTGRQVGLRSIRRSPRDADR